MYDQDGNGFYEEFEKAYQEEIKSLKRPTVLICGYTGTGKTTIIQKICGKEMVPDHEIAHDAPGTKLFKEYSSPLIRFWDSRGLEPGNQEERFLSETRDFVKNVQRSASVDDHIHIVWYCIQGAGARVTPSDERLINEIFGKDKTLVLITKNDVTKPIQRESITNYLISKGVSEDMIIPVAEDDHNSLRVVIQKTHELLPEAYKDAFISAQILSVEDKEKKAHTIIHTAAASAAATGALPVPGPDAPIITGIQFTMIAGLAVLYGFNIDMIKGMIGPALAKLVGKQLASSLTKLIPVLGSVINAAVAAAITEALGWQVQGYLKKAAINRIDGKPIEGFTFDWRSFEKLFKIILDGKRES